MDRQPQKLYALPIFLMSWERKNLIFIAVSYPFRPVVLNSETCLCWGFTAQSTLWGHVERGQFT